MNIYVIVEGEVGEKKVYQKWIPFVNPTLIYSHTIDDVINNNYYIIHGGGYPCYFKIIENAIRDVINRKDDGHRRVFDRLVVSIDAEDFSLEEKRSEIINYIKTTLDSFRDTLDYRIIVQHFCLETWCLGNKKIVGQNIANKELKKFIQHYDVSKSDPEGLTTMESENLNRAQLSEKYLRFLLQNKHRNLTYTKSNPGVLLTNSYFEQVKQRLESTGHISSFEMFLDAFAD